MKTIMKNNLKRVIFIIVSITFFIIAYNTSKADFIIQAEDYKAGESIGYYDKDAENRGGACRTTEGVDTYGIAGIKDGVIPVTAEDGAYRVSYIESGEWLSYEKNIPTGDSGNESGIYKVYLRAASALNGNQVRVLYSFEGGPVQVISSTTFNSTGVFSNKDGAVWKDIEIGTVVLKEGTNNIKLDFTTGAASDWEYSINYLKFVKQGTVKVNYDNGSMFLLNADYNKMSKLPDPNPTVLGDVEEATVNGSQEIRGFVWKLTDSTIKYSLDIEIYDSNGTTLIGTMTDFAVASELNPPVIYSVWDLRNMIAMGVFPLAGDYHGFSLGKKAILEHAQIRFGITTVTNVKIKIIPKSPAGAENLFVNKMISGTVTPPTTYDKSITVDKTDMSQFPQIAVYFTTVGINSITKLGGSAENGEVNELSDLSYGTGDVLSIEDKGEVAGMPIDVRVIYENTNSMNNAALTKINSTINTLKSKGFILNRKDIKIEIGAANTGIWSNVYNTMDEVINQNTANSFDYSRKSYKWIVLAAAANNYNPVAAQVDKLAGDMLVGDRNVIFTVVDQDTGNNITNDIDAAFKNSSYEEEGGKYYSGHLGVGKTGEYMLDAANMYIVGKIKQWKVIYNSPLSYRDGTERRRNFIVVDELGGSHGPAISYYRAPRYGAADQTIIINKTDLFDLKVKPITFIDSLTGSDYESVKYVTTDSTDSAALYNYSEERYFRPEFEAGNFNNKFTYTGDEEKAYVMINKSVVDGTGIQNTKVTNTVDTSKEIKYQVKYKDISDSEINGLTTKWSWKRTYDSNEISDQVMIRVIKGAYAADERYNVFDKDKIKVPLDAIATPTLMSDFTSTDSMKYVDLKFPETTTNSTGITTVIEKELGAGVKVTYTSGRTAGSTAEFSIRGLPASNTYTIQLYSIKNFTYEGFTEKLKVITYEVSKEMIVANAKVDVLIKDPVTNGSFKYDPNNTANIIIEGKARSVITKSNSAVPTYEKPDSVKISIYENGDVVSIIKATGIECVIEDAVDSNGYHIFKGVVPDLWLRETGKEKFDVKAEAYKSEKTAQDYKYNIGIDAGAPKIKYISMINKTEENKLKTMMASDGNGQVFTDMETLNFSTLMYKSVFGIEDYKYPSGIAKIITVEKRSLKDESGNSLDGRFVKRGDEVEITAVINDENFDISKLNLEENKNVVKADFENLTTNYTPPTTISCINNIAGVTITATWKLNISNTANGRIAMNLRVIDAIGNNTESKIEEIEIAVVDNTKPKNPSIKISKVGNANPVTITNSDYEVNCTAPYTIDENGIRAFKVLYTYDSSQSDWGSAGRTDIGKHDGDKYEGSIDPGLNGVANRYFYIKAGDGINLIDEIIQPSEGTGLKELAGRFDDGMYSKYRVLAVDKAGNETEAADIEKTLIVDTIAPRITDEVLRKIADGSGFVPKYSTGNIAPYPDNLAKGGDTVRIEYSATDFNIASENTINYYDAKYLWMLPVSTFQTSNIIFGSIDTNLTYESENRKGYKAMVKIGEKDNRYSSPASPPNIIIQNTTSNGPKDITISATDLAGNTNNITISPVLDNTAPEAVEVYAYAYELYAEPSYEQYVEMENVLYGNEAGIYHITRGGDVRDFFVEFKNITEDTVYYTVSLGTIESSLKDLPISTGNKLFSKMHGEADFMPVHGLNSVSARVRDLAGNQSEVSSVNGRIVLDTMVGNATTMAAQQGGTAKFGSNGYEFAIKLMLPEYAGINNIQIKKIANGTILKEINGVEPLEINQVPNCLGINETISKTIIVPKSQIPDIVKGTRVSITFRITDNLDNYKDFSINYLIPKEGVQIRAQQTGSEKETRTKVKVVGENQFELQNMEEGGKTK